MSNPKIASRQAVNRLAQRLQLPDTTTHVQISLAADRLAQITITRLLSEAEIEELGTWYVVEGLERVPTGTTTFDLEARPAAPEPSPVVDCHPVEQQTRQDRLEELYAADGRHDPDHPHHGTYTGLVAPAPGDG